MPRLSKQSKSTAVSKGKNPVRGAQAPANASASKSSGTVKSKAAATSTKSNTAPAGRGSKRRRDDDGHRGDEGEAESSRQAGRPSKKISKASPVEDEALEEENSPQPAEDIADPQERGESDDEGDAEVDFSAPVLKARPRRIPNHVMDSKWVHLTDAQQNDAQTIIQTTARKVLMQFRNDRQRTDAQRVLDQISEKFERRLGRYLAPQCKDFAFNYEKLYDENRKMEAILEPSTIQITELQATIESEKAALERDKQQLETLKKNAHGEEVVRKKQARTMHPSLRMSVGDEYLADPVEETSLRVVEEDPTDTTNLFDVADDKPIRTLTKKLQNHVASMQTNRAALSVIPEHMQITRAFVDDVVYGKINKYDEMSGLCLAPIFRQGQDVE